MKKTALRHKVARFLKKRGFAVALVAAVAVSGGATYGAYRNGINKLTSGIGKDTYQFTLPTSKPRPALGAEPNENEPAAAVNAEQPGVPRNDTQSAEVIDVPANANEAGVFKKPEPPRAMPLAGDITVPYSNGELVKSETLGKWKTHDGVDIAAEVGTPVASAAKGVVKEVYSDPLWGVCIAIEETGEAGVSENGAVAYYMNLDNSVLVSAGQEVTKGEIIGAVGNTALCEVADAPHLHFAVKLNGEWSDPVAYCESQA